MSRRDMILMGAALAVVAVTSVVLFQATRPPAALPQPLPHSIAVIGDSISQGVNLDRDRPGAAHEHSWAAGQADDSVQSHYERLLTAAMPLTEHAYNNAIPGSTIVDAPGMANATIAQGAEYVVILIGANDVCTPTAAEMTAPGEFETHFTTTMQRLTTGPPNASIYVVSIPDIYRLWEVLHDELVASTVWASGGICQSMLAEQNSDADRQAVRDRNVEFNAILERVCSTYAQCRFDGNAVFEQEFSADEVSNLDYFHPSEAGQATIAEVSWANGYWPEL